MQENRTKKNTNRPNHPHLLFVLPSLAIAGAVALGIGTPGVALANTGETTSTVEATNKQNVYRLFNPTSGEHLYTASFYEAKKITEEQGWQYEGIGFTASSDDGQPVYRLYNPKSGQHLWTTDAYERYVLNEVRGEWDDEGVAWYGVGNNKMTRLYNPATGQHLYTRDAYEVSVITKDGWDLEADAGTWSIISANDYAPIKGDWIDSSSWTHDSVERYWVAADGNMAKSRYIDPSTNPLDANAGLRAYATETGAIVRGAYKVDDSHAMIADDDGRIATGMKNGFVSTSAFADSTRTYYFENDLARIGLFTVGGKEYFANPETGALVLSGSYTDTSTGMVYFTNGQGVVTKKEVANYGEQVARLAVAVAAGESGTSPRNTSSNPPFTTINDPRVAKWNSLVDATLCAFGGNQAYSSCAQAVAAVVGATVDPDIAGDLTGKDTIQWPSHDMASVDQYCAEHPEMYQPVTSWQDMRPGDILCNPGHIAIYVGQDATQVRFSSSNADVFSAAFPTQYPELISFGKEYAYSRFTHVYHVIAKNSNPRYPFIDISKYLN